jgi:hypothetical protein
MLYALFMDPLSITAFRAHISDHFTDAVVKHRPVAVSRSNDVALLLAAEDLAELLDVPRFEPRVFAPGSGGRVQIWLGEFDLYGEGESLAHAKADLLDEVRFFVAEYLGDLDLYRRAPNQAGRIRAVVAAYAADLQGRLEDLIFPGPPAPPAGAPSGGTEVRAAQAV